MQCRLSVSASAFLLGHRMLAATALDWKASCDLALNAGNKNYWSTAGNGFLGLGAPRTVKLTPKVEL